MQLFRQFMALLRLNLSGAAQRLGPVLTIVIGETCAVGTLVSLLAMGSGAQRQELGNVRPDRVVVSGVGAQSAISSTRPPPSAICRVSARAPTANPSSRSSPQYRWRGAAALPAR
jgi:hypothetical protein